MLHMIVPRLDAHAASQCQVISSVHTYPDQSFSVYPIANGTYKSNWWSILRIIRIQAIKTSLQGITWTEFCHTQSLGRLPKHKNSKCMHSIIQYHSRDWQEPSEILMVQYRIQMDQRISVSQKHIFQRCNSPRLLIGLLATAATPVQ